MTLLPEHQHRLDFLGRVVRKEVDHLNQTDKRLFKEAFTVEQAKALDLNPDLSERVEAFVSRFCRLQDSVPVNCCHNYFSQ